MLKLSTLKPNLQTQDEVYNQVHYRLRNGDNADKIAADLGMTRQSLVTYLAKRGTSITEIRNSTVRRKKV